MNRRHLDLFAASLTAITALSPVPGQSKKALPDAEIVGLESVTKTAFSDIVREKCDGKY